MLFCHAGVIRFCTHTQSTEARTLQRRRRDYDNPTFPTASRVKTASAFLCMSSSPAGTCTSASVGRARASRFLMVRSAFPSPSTPPRGFRTCTTPARRRFIGISKRPTLFWIEKTPRKWGTSVWRASLLRWDKGKRVPWDVSMTHGRSGGGGGGEEGREGWERGVGEGEEGRRGKGGRAGGGLHESWRDSMGRF